MSNLLGTLFIISAPSGAGKTSLVNSLGKILSNLRVSVSHTTRPPRPGEQQGVDYHFISEAEFKEMIHQHLFLEHAQVFGHYYGTSRLWVEDMLAQRQDVILEIDWQGARQIRSIILNTQSIFILPPSKKALLQRLNQRHQDNTSIIEQRMQEAASQISHYREYDFVIVNDVFEEALRELQAIFLSQRLRLKYQAVDKGELISKLIE